MSVAFPGPGRRLLAAGHFRLVPKREAEAAGRVSPDRKRGGEAQADHVGP